MNTWALLILTAAATLAARALLEWLWDRWTATGCGGTAREVDADIGDAGSGDTRIYIFEGPKFHRFRRWLTRRM